MAMGNFCYAQGIECPYATASGDCLDDIFSAYDLCEMLGDDMPPKGLPAEERRSLAIRSKEAREITILEPPSKGACEYVVKQITSYSDGSKSESYFLRKTAFALEWTTHAADAKRFTSKTEAQSFVKSLCCPSCFVVPAP